LFVGLCEGAAGDRAADAAVIAPRAQGGRSTAAIFGIVLSMIAFFASMGVSAIDVVIYFQRH